MKTSWYQASMKAIQCFLFIFLFSFTGQTTAEQDVCPPWFKNTSNPGSSSSLSSTVRCDPDFILLRLGNCMTYNSTTDVTEVGSCQYIQHLNITSVDHVLYITLPSNVSLLNESMCGPLNREGTLCGKCKDGYGTALYSYTLECSKCWGHGYGWVLYYFLELFPITVMYFLVVIFHIRATSSPLSALVFMSQIVVYTTRGNIHLYPYIENIITGFPYVALQVLLVLCGIWSLDFFRSVIPPFCVSSNIKAVHALAPEYIVAFYPIFLILITYVCIKLHDNNFRPVVWLWKPFHRYFVHFRRRWDSKASIVNAFTTFLLLSFSKILFVSFTLLYTSYVDVYDHDVIHKECVLYFDSTVGCYSQEHLIFATIAICVLLIFIISPIILLILYPTRLFRKCVSCCGFRRWHALHMFVESFQGEYKDGTNGTRDFRMASATFLILRILILVSFHNYSLWISAVAQFALICAVCFYVVARPYKMNFGNNVDVLILALLGTPVLLLLLAVYFHLTAPVVPYYSLVIVLLLGVPHMVLILYICSKLANKLGITECLKRKGRLLKRCVHATRPTSEAEADVETESDTGSLPDRLVNPGEYEPVLPTTEEHTDYEVIISKDVVNEEPKRMNPVYTYGSIS